MWLSDLLFFSLLQIWYFEVWVSRSVLDSPLEFEITRADCTIYSRTSVFRTSLGPWKFVLDMDGSRLIATLLEVNWDVLGISFRSSVKMQGAIKKSSLDILRMNKIKPQSVDNFILFNIFGRRNKISKLLISVGIRCKHGKGEFKWENGQSWS